MKISPIYTASFALGGAGAWFISRFAFRFGLMDIPNERSSHEIPIPIPKGGGIGILAAFLFPFYADELTTMIERLKVIDLTGRLQWGMVWFNW